MGLNFSDKAARRIVQATRKVESQIQGGGRRRARGPIVASGGGGDDTAMIRITNTTPNADGFYEAKLQTFNTETKAWEDGDDILVINSSG